MNLSTAAIEERLESADLAALPPIKISILRTMTVEMIVPYLRYLAFENGLNAEIAFGDYDNIFQEASGSGNAQLLTEQTGCVMIFSNLDTLSPQFSRDFSALDEEKIEQELTRIDQYFNGVISQIRRRTPAPLLWHGLETPLYPALGALDSQTPQGQAAVVSRINESLKKTLRGHANAYFVDLNLCLARLGAKKFYDLRYWHIARAPFSNEGLREIALEDIKYIRAAAGKSKKCLVLDCDNVLWGGVVGEDGIDGILLGPDYPGSPYLEFQREVVNLYRRGVIVALCSKNNPEDVWEVFRKHPHMALREEHIAASQINWEDKPANLRRLSAELNIGLDSLVFCDDSEFEVNLVRQALPEVQVIHLPKNGAVEYRNMLASCGLFDTLTVSGEDKKRGAMYKAEAERKKASSEFTDLPSYYKSLEMVVTIAPADAAATPRLAQLTQKTNQFNLTTKRHTEADIRKMAASDSHSILYLHLQDRFGDSGIVGVSILAYDGDQAIFDTFLFSCRALGRGLEDVLLNCSLRLAQARGKKKAIGIYSQTAKNDQVRGFFTQRKFRVIGETSATVTSQFDLKEFRFETPDFFKQVISKINLNGETHECRR